MIVLRSPKGWTGPKNVDGLKTEGYWRAHQVPIPDMSKPEHVKLLEGWMTSYRPRGIVRRRWPAEARDRGAGAFRRPADERQPARQWRLAAARARDARFHQLRGPGHPARRRPTARRRGSWAAFCATSSKQTLNFRLFGPDETASNRLSAVFEATDRAWVAETLPEDDHLAPDGQGHGNSERAYLRGLARRLSADRPARVVQLLRGLYPHRRLDVQPARQMARKLAQRSHGGGRSPRSTTC